MQKNNPTSTIKEWINKQITVELRTSLNGVSRPWYMVDQNQAFKAIKV